VCDQDDRPLDGIDSSTQVLGQSRYAGICGHRGEEFNDLDSLSMVLQSLDYVVP
jgi:hypothetical protein